MSSFVIEIRKTDELINKENTHIKQNLDIKKCWFCDKPCKTFVSICNICQIERFKKIKKYKTHN
jgi:hypothetical protein